MNNLRKSTKRWLLDDLLESFVHAFGYVFPGIPVDSLSKRDAVALWKQFATQDQGVPKAISDGGTVVAFLYTPGGTGPAAAIRIRLRIPATHQDVRFSRCLSKVFNQDLAKCADSPETDELWNSLKRTRFERAIARFVPFRTHPATEWIHTMENSMTLTYEGRAPRHTIIFCHDIPQTAELPKRNIIRFREPISVEDALLKEKWVRTAVDTRRAALIATARGRGRVIGLLSFSTLPQDQPLYDYAPHGSLIYLQAFLKASDMALVASPAGDLFIIIGTGIVLQRTQGRWHYINYAVAHDCLRQFLSERVTRALLRAILDLSFERLGALFCIPDRRDSIDSLVPDCTRMARPNQVLRDSLRGLDICMWEQRQLMTAAAATDGATVLSRAGKLLDIACMIANPHPDRIRRVTGKLEARTYTGARSTAAWNASLYGTTLKISEDGPITIYRHGQVIHQIGGAS